MTKKLQPDKRVADLVQPAGECGGMSKKSADKALRVDDLIMHYAFQLALITAICFFYFQSTEGIVQLNK